MLVHVKVHSRSDEDRCLHRQVGGDEHVVGNAVCHLAQSTGRAGSYQHGVGPQAEVHMGVPRAVALREELADDRLVGQRRQGDGGDELLACRGDDDLHLSTLSDEAADDEAGLVGGNGAGNTQNNLLSFEHVCLVC